jgi:hypothetical protein
LKRQVRRVRATGQGFSYNTGRAVGSLVPALVGVLAGGFGLGTAMGVCAACAYMLVLVATSMLPETRGRELEASVEPPVAAPAMAPAALRR